MNALLNAVPDVKYVTVSYKTEVFTELGWKFVEITAEAKPLNTTLVKVSRVLYINSKPPVGFVGDKRSGFNAVAIARREVGVSKRLSSCTIHRTE